LGYEIHCENRVKKTARRRNANGSAAASTFTVVAKSVDMALELETLSFALANRS
jgi:hypothetical protein